MTDRTAMSWKKGQPAEKLQAVIREAATGLSGDILSFDDSGRALPPWQAIADYEPHSLGWRMGSGEDYWHDFGGWYASLKAEERTNYRIAYPEPEGWSGFYETKHKRRKLEEVGHSNG